MLLNDSVNHGRTGWPHGHGLVLLGKGHGKHLNIQYCTREKENTAKITENIPKTFMAYFTNPIIERHID